MDEFIAAVNEYISGNNLIGQKDRILVACSGGPDSVALFHVLGELQEILNVQLGVAHFDHRIRPESEDDRDFVRRLAEEKSLPFYTESADVAARSRKNGCSLEEAARHCRYEFLESTADGHAYGKIAVGHNRDDRIETVLFNIVRGTGISGLKGIPPRRGRIIRPLMSMSRKEILKWLKSRKFKYRIDATNKDPAYTRNRIRHRLLPYIRRNFNPDFDNAVERLSLISGEIDDYITAEALDSMDELILEDSAAKIILDLNLFLSYHVALRRIIVRELLKRISGIYYSPDYNTIDSFLEFCARNDTGKKIFPHGVVAELIGGRIVFGIRKDASISRELSFPGIYADDEYKFSIKGTLLDHIPGNFEYRSENRNIAYFDGDKLCGDLHLRNVKAGDEMIPLGMNGHKKVMDLLAENGVPSFLKNNYFVLTSSGKIAWLVGVRTSEEFKIDSSTREALRLEYAEQSPD
jgi:tRNA(Ile)-lysidine synthase